MQFCILIHKLIYTSKVGLGQCLGTKLGIVPYVKKTENPQ